MNTTGGVILYEQNLMDTWKESAVIGGKWKHLMFYVFIVIQILVGFAVSDREEWRAITEMTVCK